MKILLTGTTGYIGKRLLIQLNEAGHEVYCVVRDKQRFRPDDRFRFPERIRLCEADLLDKKSLEALPRDIDLAFYLVHGMSTSATTFNQLERNMAENFRDYLDSTDCRQCIYLSGIVNDKDLSQHLSSRLETENILRTSRVPLTVLRAAIIIGSGSASFEIIRDLVEKLPLMVAPKWLKTRCQPISIRNVLEYLQGVMGKQDTFGQSFDIGGPDILTYKEMLLGYARFRNLKRYILTLPVLTPRLSSYWLYFVTSTSWSLARSLVSSMENEVIVQDHRIDAIVPIEKLSYQEAIALAMGRIRQSAVLSSWKDAVSSGKIDERYTKFIEVPREGCFTDRREFEIEPRDLDRVLDNIWEIGGQRGWYYGNWLWKLRGLLDKLVGGVGLRRGRRDARDLVAGDALDFWRVLVADRKNRRLLLFAEMKLPGEAWLEFYIRLDAEGKHHLVQEATFRPLGLWGRIYWYLVFPLHNLVFPGMVGGIIRYRA